MKKALFSNNSTIDFSWQYIAKNEQYQYQYWILEYSNININIENLIDLYPCSPVSEIKTAKLKCFLEYIFHEYTNRWFINLE